MKVLFNVHGYKPAYNVGGPIHSVEALAEGLASRGHQVFVATSNWNVSGPLDVDPEKTYDRNGVQVRYFAAQKTWLQRTRLPYFSKSGYFRFDPTFRRWLEDNGRRFDIFHTQITYLSSTPYFAGTASRMGKVYLFHQRGNLDPIRLQFRSFKKRLYVRFVELPAMSLADVLIALTQYEVTTYQALGLKNRIVVIPNGIRVAASGSNSSREHSTRISKFLRRCDDEPLFIFLARLHPLKGADLFVEAFLAFACQHDRGLGVLAGPDECGLQARLREKIAATGMDQRLCYVGVVEGVEKSELLERADCLVLPTASEGFSMSILEAMAADCAILTTPGAHFPEVETAGAGLVVDRSQAGIAHGLLKLAKLGRTGIREKAKRGKELVRKHYSWPRIVDAYEAVCFEEMSRRCTR
jgi:glycosyltransferase involved in cell wall biosynthesis